MQVNPNNANNPVNRVSWTTSARAASGHEDGDSVQFDRAAALERALADTPEVRPDRVEHARRLITDPQYPPAETINRIASLLASNLQNDSAGA